MSSYLSYFYSYHHAVCWDKNECLGTDTHVERMDGWKEGMILLLLCCWCAVQGSDMSLGCCSACLPLMVIMP